MSSVKWSPHAESLLEEIVLDIANTLYPDDGIRWEMKLREAAAGLGDFPLSHPTIPVECYHTVPPNPERLLQLIVKPYRIVYEIVDSEVHILSIRHGRMLVALNDTSWH